MELAHLSAMGIATVRRIEAGHDTYLGTIEKLAKGAPSQTLAPHRLVGELDSHYESSGR